MCESVLECLVMCWSVRECGGVRKSVIVGGGVG